MSTITILVVEDEQDLAEILCFSLRGRGYLVRHATDGVLALQYLDEVFPDLIVTDVMMPVMDGCDLLEHLRRDERLRAIPLLVLSSMSEEVVREMCQSPFAFMNKPFRATTLLDTIQDLLAKGRSGGQSFNSNRDSMR